MSDSAKKELTEGFPQVHKDQKYNEEMFAKFLHAGSVTEVPIAPMVVFQGLAEAPKGQFAPHVCGNLAGNGARTRWNDSFDPAMSSLDTTEIFRHASALNTPQIHCLELPRNKRQVPKDNSSVSSHLTQEDLLKTEMKGGVAPSAQLLACYPPVRLRNESLNLFPGSQPYRILPQSQTAVATPLDQNVTFLQPSLSLGLANVGAVKEAQMPHNGVQASDAFVGVVRALEERTPREPAKRRKRKNRLCDEPSCTKNARGRTRFCVRHGGGARCSVEGCEKGARPHSSYCSGHGGGHRCLFSGCNKGALAKSVYCRRHGKFRQRRTLI